MPDTKRPLSQFYATLELAGWCIPRSYKDDLRPPEPALIRRWRQPPYHEEAVLNLIHRASGDGKPAPEVLEVLRAYGVRLARKSREHTYVYVRDLVERFDLDR